MTSSLAGLRKKIERQVPRLGRKPYSMQIVSLALGLIERDYGQREVNRAIEDFGLDELGWSKVNLRSREGRRDEVETKIENHKAELHATLMQVVEWSESGELERLEVGIEKAAHIARNIRYLGELDGRERKTSGRPMASKLVPVQHRALSAAGEAGQPSPPRPGAPRRAGT